MTDAGPARRAVVVHPDDSVATLVDDHRDRVRLADGGPVAPGVPYGHKVALHAISAGDRIVKYGVVIGTATQAIAAGAHVHVHNVADNVHVHDVADI